MPNFFADFDIIFFKRTALDECVSIDIAEKYKTTAWEAIDRKQKKENNKLAWLDWDVNTVTTTHLTRLDWVINARRNSKRPREALTGWIGAWSRPLL